MEQFKQRLIEFIDSQYGMSQRKFEEMCGLGHGTINSIKIKGPSADILSRISDKCRELNMNWLFRGEGNMLNGGEDVKVAAAATKGPLIQNVFVTNFSDLKEIIVQAINESGR